MIVCIHVQGKSTLLVFVHQFRLYVDIRDIKEMKNVIYEILDNINMMRC